jgi:hypothetical protein
MSDWTGVAN